MDVQLTNLSCVSDVIVSIWPPEKYFQPLVESMPQRLADLFVIVCCSVQKICVVIESNMIGLVICNLIVYNHRLTATIHFVSQNLLVKSSLLTYFLNNIKQGFKQVQDCLKVAGCWFTQRLHWACPSFLNIQQIHPGLSTSPSQGQAEGLGLNPQPSCCTTTPPSDGAFSSTVFTVIQ